MFGKSKLTAAAAALICAAALGATELRETRVFEPVWDAVPAESPTQRPADDSWGKYKFDRNWQGIPGIDLRGAKTKPSRPIQEYKSAWYRQKIAIPAAWDGGTVRFQVPIQYSDMRVMVNGKPAGEILKPAGELDITPLLRYGAENTVELYQTTNRTDISNRPESYTARPNWQFGFQQLPTLTRTGKIYLDDVFANPSFRKKQLELETGIYAAAPAAVTVSARILDRDGKTVKQTDRKVELRKGLNPVTLTIPWRDPRCWEINAPYLYRCEVEAAGPGGAKLDTYPPFRFGFREIWRDGKEIYMNGHIQRIRPVFGFGINRHGVSFYRMIGYTAVDLAEKHYNFSTMDENLLDRLDEVGMACFAGMPSINYMRDKMRKDPAAIAEYERYARLMMRRYRNHPSIFAWCVGMNTNCPIWNIAPEKFAQIEGYTAQDQNINAARAVGRKFSPGTLFYSHADGSNADISTNNIYLNLTPIQEREEWVSQWAQKGIYPWLGAEFGEPYVANFWQRKNFLFTEYMAIYYGEKAYAGESDKARKMIVPLSLANKNGHADGCVGLDTEFPLFWDFKRDITWRTNRAWRTFGINGGMLYFNLREAYGTPPGHGNPYGRYGRIREELTAKPAWANASFDIHQLGNHDFVGYLGGAPAHTDKTHAYYSGETVAKQLVMVWDGPGQATFNARWRAVRNGKTIAAGTAARTLGTGDIRFDPIRFTAPAVASRTPVRLEAEFLRDGKTLFKDAFDLTVWPRLRREPMAVRGQVAVLDPSGKAQAILRYFGVPFRAIRSTDDLGDAQYLIFGKNALDNAALGFSRGKIAAGLRVLVLPQTPETWRSLGFKPLDSMSRQVFRRDGENPVFGELGDDLLRNWRGAPAYGDKPYGSIMSHDSQRGPRWTRTHTVAGLMLQIPERAGFLPLIDGEFDLNYAALMRYRHGKGAMDWCTLDFEDRVPADPLAERTAHAVLTDYFGDRGEAGRTVCADGNAAFALLQKTASEPVAFRTAAPSQSVAVIGRDAKTGWNELKAFAEKGGRVLIVANPRLAAEAGLRTGNRKIQRVAPDGKGIFRTVGQSLLRWRDEVDAPLIQSAPGFRIHSDGLFATAGFGLGQVVFAQLDPEVFAERHAKDAEKRTVTALSTEHMIQLYARILTNLGAAPGAKTTDRLTYQAGTDTFAPLKYCFVLGPFRAPRDDSKAMLNTVFPGEAMAIAGDNNPNPRFKLPQGGEVDWRPMISPDENGFVNLTKLNKLYRDVDLSVSYVIAPFERKEAGSATLKFGVDWRAKVWCNGQPVFYTESGSKGYKFETKVNLKKGENYISMKIGSGSNGNGFWAALSEPPPKGAIPRKNIGELDRVKLYENSIEGYDPYTFHYW